MDTLSQPYSEVRWALDVVRKSAALARPVAMERFRQAVKLTPAKSGLKKISEDIMTSCTIQKDVGEGLLVRDAGDFDLKQGYSLRN